MTILAMISMFAVILMIGSNLCRHGELPRSVSSMAYRLPGRQRYLWTLWMWVCVYTLTPALFEAVPDWLEAAPHAFATCMLLITVMPLFKRDMSNGHRALIVAAGVFSQACVAVLCPWILLLWPAAFMTFFMWDIAEGDIPRIFWGKGVLVAEVLCYATLFISIIIKLSLQNG